MHIKTLKTAFKICQFKSGPQEMPNSIALLSVLIPIIFLCRLATFLPWFTHSASYSEIVRSDFTMTAVYLLCYYCVLFAFMAVRGLTVRYLQTAIAISAVTVLMYAVIASSTFLALLWSSIMSFANGKLVWALTIKIYEHWFSYATVLIAPLFYVLILPRIFQITFNTSYWKGFVVNFGLILLTVSLQCNIAHWLI
jgi:hypothetical protein